MAEKIIKDLRNTGNESLDSLINMLNSYKQKQVQTAEEIQKLKKLILLKDDELVQLDDDILSLKVTINIIDKIVQEYVSTAKDR